jgi:hypothetical protein
VDSIGITVMILRAGGAGTTHAEVRRVARR